jgi:hypothetical protein
MDLGELFGLRVDAGQNQIQAPLIGAESVRGTHLAGSRALVSACSMSRSGNVWDNAAMESFFSSLKTERTARKLYRRRDEAKADDRGSGRRQRFASLRFRPERARASGHTRAHRRTSMRLRPRATGTAGGSFNLALAVGQLCAPSLRGIGGGDAKGLDTYTKVSFAKLYDRKTPITAADLLNDRALPFFEQHDRLTAAVSSAAIPNGTSMSSLLA